jgi:hypothetical protein
MINTLLAKRRTVILYGIVMYCLVSLSSCNVFRKAIVDTQKTNDLEEIFNKVSQSVLPDIVYASRMSISYVGSENQLDLKGSIVGKRDSVLLVSISALLGIEVVRVLFDQDSVAVLDRVNRRYQKGNYTMAQELMAVDFQFDFLQNLLFNGFLVEDLGLSHSYLVERNDGSVILVDSSNNLLRGFNEARFTISTNNYRLSKIELIDRLRKRFLVVEYLDYFVENQMFIPGLVKIRLQEKGEQELIELKYGKVVVNEPVKIHFTIPERYKNAK